MLLRAARFKFLGGFGRCLTSAHPLYSLDSASTDTYARALPGYLSNTTAGQKG